MLNPGAELSTYDMVRCLQCFFSTLKAGNRIRNAIFYLSRCHAKGFRVNNSVHTSALTSYR